MSGRGVIFFSDSQDFYMGEVEDGKFHGKGLFYRKSANQWELGVYDQGKQLKCIKNGDGRPQSLDIQKELVDEDAFKEIYIKPKDLFFDHYEGDMVNAKREGNGILYSRDGSRYEGTWKDNKPNGIGVYVYADQKFDIGEY